MATDFNGSTQYLTAPVNSVLEFGAGDFAISFRVNVRNFNNGSRYVGLSLGRGANGNPSLGGNFVACAWWFFLYSGTNLYFGRTDTTGDFYVNITTTLATNSWLDVVASRTSGTLRLYLNGSQVGADSNYTTQLDRVSSGGSQDLHIGYALSGNPSENSVAGQPYFASYANAIYSEIAIWKGYGLTAAEVTALSKGIAAPRVRARHLSFYAPLIRNPQDVRGGLTITNNNGATVANHPRLYL